MRHPSSVRQPRDRAPSPRSPSWHAREVDEVAAELGVAFNGLSEQEAAARRELHGANEIDAEPPPSWLVIVLGQFRSPLIYILLVATAVTLAMGEYLDAIVIGAVLALNALIGSVQQRRAERSVRALQQLVTPRARVLRDGHEAEIDSRLLVPGDVVLLESGVQVPADVRLVEVTTLQVDESLLTGESLPSTKSTDVLPERAGIGDRTNVAFAGTVVTSGRARGLVVATGMSTELGQIAEQVRSAEEPLTPVQRRAERFAHRIGALVLAAAGLAFAIGLAIGESAAHMLTFAVALAVSAIPEGLPVVFTIVLAIGVSRMARRGAIIRQLPAVETLGSTTVIASDKTGTLTQNRMTVDEIRTATGRFVLDGEHLDEDTLDVEDVVQHRELYLTLLTGVLASEADAYRSDGELHTTGDPTEAALVRAAAQLDLEPWQVRSEHARLGHLPFEPQRRFAAVRSRLDGEVVLLVQGAPERVLDMCTEQLVAGEAHPLDRVAIEAAGNELAARGRRVLAFAYRPDSDSGQIDPQLEPAGLTFLGLQAMADPPRPGVRDAVGACRDAGIRVVMVTGDHAATAAAIAEQIGIEAHSVVSGEEVESLGDAELLELTRTTDVFARVAPEHKLRIVELLHDQDEVIAVTGDGVNDAPALQAAHIGIAMGKDGTDVAREASDMVLTDDDFVTIVAAVEEGRVTFDNLRKATFFLISTGAAEILMLLTALSLGWPLLFVPAQLLWLNLVTNGLQDVALAFEPGEPGVLQRRPRARGEGLVSALLWERTAIVAVVMAIGTLVAFQWALTETGSLETARTAALTTMVFFQAVHVGNSRSERRSAFLSPPWANRFLLVSVIAALAIHAAALQLSATQWLLRVVPLEPRHWLRGALIALSVLVVVEVHKALRRESGTGTPRAARRRRGGGRARRPGG